MGSYMRMWGGQALDRGRLPSSLVPARDLHPHPAGLSGLGGFKLGTKWDKRRELENEELVVC